MTPSLLTPREVAAMFAVQPKTVSRWADRGILPYVRTPGGHKRYPIDAVEQLLAAGIPERAPAVDVEAEYDDLYRRFAAEADRDDLYEQFVRANEDGDAA